MLPLILIGVYPQFEFIIHSISLTYSTKYKIYAIRIKNSPIICVKTKTGCKILWKMFSSKKLSAIEGTSLEILIYRVNLSKSGFRRGRKVYKWEKLGTVYIHIHSLPKSSLALNFSSQVYPALDIASILSETQLMLQFPISKQTHQISK